MKSARSLIDREGLATPTWATPEVFTAVGGAVASIMTVMGRVGVKSSITLG